jgi:hypothetical protein
MSTEYFVLQGAPYRRYTQLRGKYMYNTCRKKTINIYMT